MSNKCGSNIIIAINNLNYPIKVLAKNDFNGINTIAKINIESITNTLNEIEFQKKIIEIIERNGQNSGLIQLSKNILTYFNSINAISTKLIFEYPYIVNQYFSDKKTSILKNLCRYIVQLDSDGKEERWFEVEIPISLKDVSQNSNCFTDLLCLPFIVLVKYKSEDLIFVEDIIEIIKNSTSDYFVSNSKKSNNDISTNQIINKISLLNDIKKNLETKYDVSNCIICFKNVNPIFSYSFGIT